MPIRQRHAKEAGLDEIPLVDNPMESGNSSPIVEREIDAGGGMLATYGPAAPIIRQQGMGQPATLADEEEDQEDDFYDDDEEEEEDEEATRHAADSASSSSSYPSGINMPYMYLRSVSMVPVESSQSSSLSPYLPGRRRRYEESPSGDPTIAARQDREGLQVWEYCWKHFKKSNTLAGMRYSNLMPIFKPILLYSASMARNMIAVNAFYHHEHIARALVYQMEAATSSQWRRRRNNQL